MSLYNMLFGVNPAFKILLATLGLTHDAVPRFRDCFLQGENIVVYTRTGGGNREYYGEPCDENKDGPWNSTLTANPYYVRDEDDDYDSTYASFYFRFPDEYAEDLKSMAARNEAMKPSEKWQELLKSFDESAKAGAA